MDSALSSKLQAFLERAVGSKTAPGLVAVVFSRTSNVAAASAGVRSLDSSPDALPMTLDTVAWMASMSKAVTSVAAIILAEKHAFDLDSHDQLVQILPELELGNQRPVSMIFEGKGEDGNWKMREARVGITLRHLLTHTSGIGYEFTSEEHRDLFKPTGELASVMEGKVHSHDVPRSFEAGQGWLYGMSADWVGHFITRLSKKTLRQVHQELIFDPLGIPADTLDSFRSPAMNENRAPVNFKAAPEVFVPLPVEATVDTPQYEGQVPDGEATLGSAALHGTVPSYAIFLRCLLNKSAPSPGAQPLISPSMWDDVSCDNLARYGLTIDSVHTTWNPMFSNNVQRYSKPAEGDGAKGEGWTALQTLCSREKSAGGGSAGTLRWSGLANSYFWVDPTTGLGAVILAQFLPWADEDMMKLSQDLEAWVFENVKCCT